MKLYSTNNKNNIVDLQEAVIKAYPKDKGLYMPVEIPQINPSFFESIQDFTFEEISYKVAKCLIGDYIPEDKLESIIYKAINFPAPVVSLTDRIGTLELFHGPSMAFKDFGARFMAELMSYFLRGENDKTTILVATSGDTGGAVAAGFHNVPGIEVIILYPSGKVSPLQEKQLTSWGDNIKAIEVDGVFDNCQAMVKQAFIDDDLNPKYKFSSANSINIARLIPQSFYYFEAYKQVVDRYDNIVFSVPSGNFGNLTAGLLAKKMGLPIHKFLAATNINDTVPQYLNTGTYNAKPSVATISNAMDVGNPSNFDRILKLYENEGSTWNNVKTDIVGYSYDDKTTYKVIKYIYDNHQYIADPHGAVGYLACKEYLSSNPSDYCIFLETAHPGKFSAVVEEALGISFDMPDKLASFMSKEKTSILCSKEYSQFKEILFNM